MIARDVKDVSDKKSMLGDIVGARGKDVTRIFVAMTSVLPVLRVVLRKFMEMNIRKIQEMSAIKQYIMY